MYFAIKIYDKPDVSALRNARGLHANVEVFRWRFGRVFDRFL